MVLKDGRTVEQISIETFMRKPRELMRMIANYSYQSKRQMFMKKTDVYQGFTGEKGDE